MKNLILATAVTASLMSFGSTNDTVDVKLLEKRIERIERLLKLNQYPTADQFKIAISTVTNFVFIRNISLDGAVIGKRALRPGFILYNSSVLDKCDGAKKLVRATSEEADAFNNAVATFKDAGFPEIDELVRIEERWGKVIGSVNSRTDYAKRIMDLAASRKPITSD